jgi:hypothetical protein
MLSMLLFASAHVVSVNNMSQPVGGANYLAPRKKGASSRAKPRTTAKAASSAKPVSAKMSIPADVEKFVKRRDICDHLRGEEAYDPQRAEELEDGMQENCEGTDKELRTLRLRYAKNPEIKAKLAKYEREIEEGPAED